VTESFEAAEQSWQRPPAPALSGRGRLQGMPRGVVKHDLGLPEAERPCRPMKLPVPSEQQAALLRLLVQRRKDAGLNQTTLASRLGITQSEVSKFERGERALDELRLRAWLRALGMPRIPRMPGMP
jgi:predicted XRE-type DNA-binding protein